MSERGSEPARYEAQLRARSENPTGEWVAVPVEERDALADAVEALRAFIGTTSYYQQKKASRPEFETLALALLRLDGLGE